MAIDVARLGGGCNLQVPLQGGSSVTQTVAVGNIYVAFTAFNYNQMGTLISSQILFSRSADCGNHLEYAQLRSAQATIASTKVRPSQSIPRRVFVYVAWRRFGSPNRADAIVAVASISAGQWFTPAIPVITLPKFDPVHPATGPNGPFSFFDQGTTSGSMRMDAFPSLAVGRQWQIGYSRTDLPSMGAARRWPKGRGADRLGKLAGLRFAGCLHFRSTMEQY